MKKLRYGILLAVLLASIGVWLWLLWLESTYDPPYCKIENGLYIGRATDEPPPGTEAVVNLCGQEDRYKVAHYHWAPVFESGKEPDLKWLRQAVDFIRTHRRAKRIVFVHCLAGMNRSGAVMVAYLMDKNGWRREKALAYVQTKRPQVQPNPILMRLLAEWEQAVSNE